MAPGGASIARKADETTSSETAMVSASCDTDADDWNIASGSRPTAQNAHFDRGVRRIATVTTAT